MATDYKLNLDLLDTPSAEPASAFAGSVTPVQSDIKPQDNSSFSDQSSAVAMDTIPARVGVHSSLMADKIYRSFSSKDDGQNTDPDWTPQKRFETWKSGNYGEGAFNTIMTMKNSDDFYAWQAEHEDQQQRAQTIAGLGLVGSAAHLVANAVTDPSMLVGAGIVNMVDEGVIAAKTAATAAEGTEGYAAARAGVGLAKAKTLATVKGGALGGAIGAAGDTAVDYATSIDDADKPTVPGALLNIGISAVTGGVLGKAIGAYGELKANKLLPDGDFADMGKRALQDADSAQSIINNPEQVEWSPQSLGAAAVPTFTADNRVGGSALGRFVSSLPLVKNISPQLRGQNYSEPEMRNFMQQLIGKGQKTADNYAGTATGGSVAELSHLRIDQGDADIRNYVVARRQQEMQTGDHFDVQSEKRAYLLSHSGKDLNDPELSKEFSQPEITTAKFYQDFYGKYRQELQDNNVPGFIARQHYGASLLLDSDLVNKDFDGFTDKMEKNLTVAQKTAPKELATAQGELDKLEANNLDEMSHTDRALTQQAIDYYSKEVDRHRFLSGASPEELREEAASVANHFASKFSRTESGENLKVLPRSFNERMLNPKDFIDFVRTNPVDLANIYSHDVAPTLAMQKVFGTPDIESAFGEQADKLTDKLTALRKAGDAEGVKKLEKELQTFKADKNNAWKDISGTRYSEQYRANPQLANASDITSGVLGLSFLGGRVLGSVSEISSALLHEGLGRGGGGLAHVAYEMATNPELRNASMDDLRQLGIGLEYFKNNELHQNITGYLRDAKVNGLTKGVGVLNRTYQKVSGGVQYDTMVRSVFGLLHQQSLKSGMERLLADKLSGEEIASLAHLGVDKSNAGKLLDQMALPAASNTDHGIFTTDISKWGDKDLADTYALAIRRDLSRHIIQHGVGEVPFWFHTPAGKIISKFKSWGVGATQQYLLPTLQRADPAKAMVGVAGFVGFSAMLNSIYNAAEGKEQPKTPTAALYLAAAKSGILGVTPELGGNWLMKHIAGYMEPDTNRYYRADTAAETLAGPLGQEGENVGKILNYGIDSAMGNEKAENEGPGATKALIDLLPIPVVKPLVKAAVSNQ